MSATALQNFQSPIPKKGTLTDARGWYHSVRRHTPGPFTVVAIHIPDGEPATVQYREGSARFVEGLPNLPGFDGYLVGTRTASGFLPHFAATPDGRPVAATMTDTLRQLKAWGFSLPACDFSSVPGIRCLEPRLKGGSPALLCMDDLETMAKLAGAGRRTVGLMAPYEDESRKDHAQPDRTPSPTAVSPPAREETPPTPTPTFGSDPSDTRPVAILSGGFSKPHAAYHAQLRAIGYQVWDSKGMETLDPAVKLVVHPTVNRITSLVKEAREKGIKTMTATHLNEAAHAARVTSGKSTFR